IASATTSPRRSPSPRFTARWPPPACPFRRRNPSLAKSAPRSNPQRPHGLFPLSLEQIRFFPSNRLEQSVPQCVIPRGDLSPIVRKPRCIFRERGVSILDILPEHMFFQR